jgi:hypothetical protein
MGELTIKCVIGFDRFVIILEDLNGRKRPLL